MDSSLAIQVADKVKVLGIIRPVLEFFEKAAVRGSVGVIAVCKALEDIARAHAPQKEIITLEDISLLDEGVTGEEDLRATLGLATPVMLYVGNLERYQGIDLLLEAFALALEGGARGSLVVIGGTPQSIEHYRRKAAGLDLADRVHFCGPRPLALLSHYLKQADILLSPRIEGNNTPMKLYSYLDSGRAVLATRLPTHTQVLNETVSCLVEPTPGSMAQGIQRLSADLDSCHELGRRGRELAQEKYSLTAYRQKLEAFYSKIAEVLK
jgi:glycosyltransferase involved in cell wall biosynthesis